VQAGYCSGTNWCSPPKEYSIAVRWSTLLADKKPSSRQLSCLVSHTSCLSVWRYAANSNRSSGTEHGVRPGMAGVYLVEFKRTSPWTDLTYSSKRLAAAWDSRLHYGSYAHYANSMSQGRAGRLCSTQTPRPTSLSTQIGKTRHSSTHVWRFVRAQIFRSSEHLHCCSLKSSRCVRRYSSR